MWFHKRLPMDSILVNDIFELFPFVDEETNEIMYEVLDADNAIILIKDTSHINNSVVL